MKTVLIANIISFIGCLLMVAIGLIKERRKILLTQCVMWTILTVSNLMLGGVTGAVSNIVSIVRNLYSLKRPLTLPVKIGFITVQAAITAFTNELGLIGWLPTLAAATFTVFMDVKDAVTLKCVIIFGQTLWAIFDFSIRNYTAGAFDVMTVISTCVGIAMLLRERRKADDVASQKEQQDDWR